MGIGIGIGIPHLNGGGDGSRGCRMMTTMMMTTARATGSHGDVGHGAEGGNGSLGIGRSGRLVPFEIGRDIGIRCVRVVGVGVDVGMSLRRLMEGCGWWKLRGRGSHGGWWSAAEE